MLLLINPHLHMLCGVHRMVFLLFTRWSCSSPVLSQKVHGTSSQSFSATTQMIVSHYRESWSTRGCVPMHAESCLQNVQPRNLKPEIFLQCTVSCYYLCLRFCLVVCFIFISFLKLRGDAFFMFVYDRVDT